MSTYILCLASLGHYRIKTVQYIKSKMGSEIEIYSGSPAYDRSISVLTSSEAPINNLKNVYLPGDVLLQNIPLLSLIRARSVILDLNPRVPHIWIVILIRKFLRRPTVLWGHAFPRSGRFAKSDKIRSVMRKLADGILTYTRTQASQLEGENACRKVFTAPNALYFRHEMRFSAEQERTNLIYVGRLDPAKKVLQAVKAFEIAAARLGDACRLVIVGDGQQMNQLRQLVDRSDFRGRIDILGHIGEFERLRHLYSTAFASLSPGYVGLSITQSFAFGVPMLISRDERHSPEIEAADDGRNCCFFETDNILSQADVMIETWAERDLWKRRGASISSECAERYSVEAMGDGIIEALSSV